MYVLCICAFTYLGLGLGVGLLRGSRGVGAEAWVDHLDRQWRVGLTDCRHVVLSVPAEEGIDACDEGRVPREGT